MYAFLCSCNMQYFELIFQAWVDCFNNKLMINTNFTRVHMLTPILMENKMSVKSGHPFDVLYAEYSNHK